VQPRNDTGKGAQSPDKKIGQKGEVAREENTKKKGKLLERIAGGR